MSATVRAMGPTTPIGAKGPAGTGKWPVAGTRPGVGFKPQIPVKCAGTRIDPPPSLPIPPADILAAIAADSPPLDPPAVRSRSHGLSVWPWSLLLVSQAIRNSGVFVLPRTMAPASLSRRTKGASVSAWIPCRIIEPHSQGKPRTAIEFLMLTGTPSSRPACPPSAIRAADARAASRAPSTSTWENAFSRGLSCSIRSR